MARTRIAGDGAYDPPEGWGFQDEVMIDLGDSITPQVGLIPRYY